MATAQIPVKTMLMAMIPGSSRLLYAGGKYPLPTITRPKMNTNSNGCKNVCRKSWTALRRATWASRASIAPKVFQFNRAHSFRCGAETGFPDWVQKCERRKVRRRKMPPHWRSPESETRRDPHTHPCQCRHLRALLVHQPVTASVAADPESDSQIEAATNIRPGSRPS